MYNYVGMCTTTSVYVRMCMYFYEFMPYIIDRIKMVGSTIGGSCNDVTLARFLIKAPQHRLETLLLYS